MNNSSIGTLSFWNKNFVLIMFSNMLLYIGMYMLFPVLYSNMLDVLGLSSDKSMFISVGLFGLSMFLPGVFNNYLVDTFRRKKVCTRCVLLLVISGMLYVYAVEPWMMCLLRVFQGALFGIIVMVTGSALVIDVTPSKYRSKANMLFAFSGAFGAMVGLFLGGYAGSVFSFRYLIYISVVLVGLSLLFASMIKVCFRAPMPVPLMSLDRFILLRNILPGVNMMTIPFILGTLVAHGTNPFFYLCVAAGFALLLLVPNILLEKIDSRISLVVGYAMLLSSIYILHADVIYIGTYISGLLAGFGIPLALIQYLNVMIRLPKHCERGTGYNTYQLMWDTGLMIGCCAYTAYGYEQFSVASLLCIIGVVLYVAVTYPYYYKKLKDRNS